MTAGTGESTGQEPKERVRADQDVQGEGPLECEARGQSVEREDRVLWEPR